MLLAAEVIILLPVALAPSLTLVVAAVVGVGVRAAPVLTARSLAIREELSDDVLVAGFSSLYAVNGAGHGVAGPAVGALLPWGSATAFSFPWR